MSDPANEVPPAASDSPGCRNPLQLRLRGPTLGHWLTFRARRV